jgi:hypothetical protein
MFMLKGVNALDKTLVTAMACLIALAVFLDARRIGMAYGWGPGGKGRLGAGGWALGCLIMPFLFLALVTDVWVGLTC